MVKSKVIEAYENANQRLADMRDLRHQGKISEELIELRELLIEIFKVYEPWSDIIHSDIIHEFGVAHQNRGDYSLALDYLWSAAKLRRRLYHPIDLFYTLHQIVMCKLARGDAVEAISEDIARARKSYEFAVAYAEAKYDYRGLGYIHHNYAFYYQVEGKYGNALLYYSVGEEFMSKADDSRGQALICLRQAQCFKETREFSQAFDCLNTAEKIFREIGDEKRLKEIEETRKDVKKAQEMVR